jgi:diguanylate cyclase (GGDEF)-like protein
MANAAVHEATAGSASLLEQAETLKTGDRSRFLQALKQLHQEESRLSPPQQWHLRYLDAYEAAFEGHMAQATPLLHDIIDHSGNTALKARATALVINILTIGEHYIKAYKLANDLMSTLPNVKDHRARVDVLHEVAQMLAWAGQYDQALKYAEQTQTELMPGESRCPASEYKIDVLMDAGRLSATSPELRKAIDLCVADNKLLYANALRLAKAFQLIDEHKAGQAIALLHRIAPSIRRIKYRPHMSELQAVLAKAYLVHGDDANARKSALAELATNQHSGYTWGSEAAYYVLYKVEKNVGHSAAALRYYEKYIPLKEADMNKAKAQALAYQMVKQEVIAKKLKMAELTRQNRILQLRQALAQKQAENSRLYIALLLVAIVVIGLWLYRIKHSQMHFRRKSRHDDLTGAFNRQYFLDEAGQTLRRLSKAGASACLLLMDLDHFKQTNDTYGHFAGDEVLKRVVEICRQELRASDVFGRIGGEEFGILMPACSREQGAEIGNRVRQALAETPIELDQGDIVKISASFGLAYSDDSGYTLKSLLTVADTALYRAKQSGRNQLVWDTGPAPEPT